MALGLRQREAFDDLEAAWRGHAGEAPSLVPTQDNDPREHRTSACPELDCVRDLLPRAIIKDAERRSADIGVGADRVLICSGAIDEETYLRRLADAHGFLFEPLDDMPRDRCALDDSRLIDAAAAGILPLHNGDELVLTVAPRGFAVRRILTLIDGNPALIRRFRLASSAQIQSFVFRHGETEIGNQAAHALHDAWPALSAAPPRWRQTFSPLIVTGLFASVALVIAPGPVMITFEVALATIFLAWMMLRVVGTLVYWPQNTRPAHIPDRELPVYTVMVALYREAAAVDGLIAALRQLDYPGIRAQTPQDIFRAVPTFPVCLKSEPSRRYGASAKRSPPASSFTSGRLAKPAPTSPMSKQLSAFSRPAAAVKTWPVTSIRTGYSNAGSLSICARSPSPKARSPRESLPLIV
jgi:hypothetical protein